MKPVRPRRANSVRSALTRWALAARSAWSSNDWKRASNMAAIYGPGGEAAMLSATRAREDQCRPALEPDATREHEPTRAIAGQRRGGLRQQQPREHDLSVRGNQARHR